MISIINKTKSYNDVINTGMCKYRIQNSHLVINEFIHDRSEGLAVCLRKAADAVEQAEMIENAIGREIKWDRP